MMRIVAGKGALRAQAIAEKHAIEIVYIRVAMHSQTIAVF